MTDSASSTPLVTVLMPTFNSARYLPEAIESILLQTWKDLNLIVLDGGSTDPTQDIVEAYARRDKRVRLEVFPGAHPAARTNEILPTLRSRFIVMQHSDDVSYLHRIVQQLRVFAEDPDIGVCSCLTRLFCHDRMVAARSEGMRIDPRPEKHDVIKANLLFWWVMNCPGLAFDREKLVAAGTKFSNQYTFGNDYWQTVTNIDKFKYYNVQEELLAYRMHTASDGLSHFQDVRQEERRLKRDVLQYFGFTGTPRQIEIHSGFRMVPDQIIDAQTPEEFEETVAWLESLKQQNNDKGVFDRRIFSTLIDALVIETRKLKTAKNQAA